MRESLKNKNKSVSHLQVEVNGISEELEGDCSRPFGRGVVTFRMYLKHTKNSTLQASFLSKLPP